jgi:hypothetical protein
MKTHIIASIIVMSAIGCNKRPVENYTIGIDPAFSGEQDQYILDAMDAWSIATSNQVVFDNFYIGDCKFKQHSNETCIYSSDAATVDAKLGEDAAIGYTEWYDGNNSAEIFIDTAYVVSATPVNAEQLFLHEFGHSFRLRHTPAEEVAYSVMCASVECATSTIQCTDVVNYEKLRNGFADCDVK